MIDVKPAILAARELCEAARELVPNGLFCTTADHVAIRKLADAIDRLAEVVDELDDRIEYMSDQ